jgi:predicted metal-binding membrane protein
VFASGSAPGRGSEAGRLDRGTVVTGALLLAAAAVAWVGVIAQGAGMGVATMAPPGDVGGMPVAGLGTNGVAFVLAWGVMMAAMMLPSATPMIALYGSVARNRAPTGRRAPSTVLFALTYLLVWLAFGIPIYGLSLGVAQLASTSAAVKALLPYGVALVLVAAGLFQFSPLKRVCLRACRSPLGFLLGHWQPGTRGALQLGLRHALNCLGCCWALMAVLVVAGAMGLPWVLLIAVVVFAEKVLPFGEWTARITGAALVVLGILVAVQPGLVPLLQGTPMSPM